MHCVETSAPFNCINKIHPVNGEQTSAANDGSIKFCAQMRSSSSADAEAQAAAAINLRILSKVPMFLIAEGS
jgi:hypothetical protein